MVFVYRQIHAQIHTGKNYFDYITLQNQFCLEILVFFADEPVAISYYGQIQYLVKILFLARFCQHHIFTT